MQKEKEKGDSNIVFFIISKQVYFDYLFIDWNPHQFLSSFQLYPIRTVRFNIRTDKKKMVDFVVQNILYEIKQQDGFTLPIFCVSQLYKNPLRTNTLFGLFYQLVKPKNKTARKTLSVLSLPVDDYEEKMKDTRIERKRNVQTYTYLP